MGIWHTHQPARSTRECSPNFAITSPCISLATSTHKVSMMSKWTCWYHEAHPICTVDQQIIFLGLSAERTVTVTIKEGKMLSSHRTDQTKKYCLLTQSEDSCSKATTIQMTPWSLWDTLVIERTYYAYSVEGILSQQLPTCVPFHCTFDPSWSCIKRN